MNRMNTSTTILVGMHDRRIDARGRVRMPLEWRARYADAHRRVVVLARCEGTYLKLLPADVWAALEGASAEPSDMARHIIDNTCTVALDTRGSFHIPRAFREVFAGESHLVYVGCLEHGELWARTAWRRYQDHRRTVFHELNL